MFLMLFEMVHLSGMARKLNEEGWGSFWSTIQFHTSHVEWTGCSLHDLIQPGFSFLVGTALAFSLRKRSQLGQSVVGILGHALIRSIVLVALGVLLRSLDPNKGIQFRFDDTLCQIGLGYFFLVAIALLPKAVAYFSVIVLLVGYWIFFAAYPLPSPDFDYPAVGVPASWAHHHEGFAAHWNKNSNAAWAFDRWWMNLFPREEEFIYSSGGYVTLSFVPTLATMLLGYLCGVWLRDAPSTKQRLTYLVSAIVICFGVAWGIDQAGVCPIVKRIWTPTWVLWSGGWCFTLILFFHLVCDIGGWQVWSFPWRVIGANSIAAYVMSYTTAPFLARRFEKWFQPLWEMVGPYSPGLIGLCVFITIWLILFWMYRNRVFVRI